MQNEVKAQINQRQAASSWLTGAKGSTKTPNELIKWGIAININS